MSLPATLQQPQQPPPLSPTPTAINTRQNPTSTTPPRSLVLCFDGTTNTFSSSLTNLPVLFSLLSADPTKQMCYYQTGIGTYEPTWTPSGILKAATRLLDSAVAWDLDKHVEDGYNFLMKFYQPGDLIFLFGFSRGAYTARALAGMLQQVGILLPGNEQSLSLAYHIYSARDEWLVPPQCGNAGCTTCGELLADAFKRSFCRDVHVHFVGVWDTVASVGAVVPKILPFAQGGRSIHYFRHALSLDEHRGRFEPQLWMPDTASDAPPCTTPQNLIRLKPESTAGSPITGPESTDIKEMWFAGAHSNVGGGQTPTDGDFAPRLSHLPLRWMIREAFDHGLQLDIAAVVASPLYTPFLPAVGSIDLSLPPVPSSPDSPHFHSKPRASPELFIDKLVHIATLPSDRFAQEALASRGDSLSFSISTKPGGFLKSLSGVPQRLRARARTAFWWLLELFPMFRVVWDVDGEVRHKTFRSHLGQGRRLPDGAVFHDSVRIRREARANDFPPGDGLSVPEMHYDPRAHFKRGDGGTVSYEL